MCGMVFLTLIDGEKMMKAKNPIQPIIDGRFKENKIVRDLLDYAQERGFGLNEIAVKGYSKDDHQQLAQLIGYSVSGYGSLSYVDDDNYGAVCSIMDEGLNEKDAQIKHLKEELDALRGALVEPMSRLFGVHPDDLSENIG